MTAAVITAEDLADRINALPRERLAVLPTGLQSLPRLAAHAGVREFFAKRDDLTGIALGGNKSRLMEFVLGKALATGCDVLVAGGGGEQSNHAVQCAASANRVGLDSAVVLQRRPDSRPSGNALLHELLGGQTVWIDSDPELRDRTSASAAMHALAAELRSQGRRPYVLKSSLHPLSIVAYANALLEIHAQLPEPSNATRIYVTSEGAAVGGLLLATKLLGLPWQVIGLDWRPTQDGVVAHLHAMISQAALLLGLENPVREADIVIRPDGGPAYGVGRAESWQAIRTAARLEGLILDPVYTAKGLAGTLADLHDQTAENRARVVFVHTGGVAAIFAYEDELRSHVIANGTHA
ncbi:MAG: pyridoxal-phosphate dependent enzyme [Mycobacteriales bacterium]